MVRCLPNKYDKDITLLELYVVFRGMTFEKEHKKSLIEDLLAKIELSKEDICKYYSGDISKVIDNLSLSQFFVLAY